MSAAQNWENMTNEEFYEGDYVVTIVDGITIVQEADWLVITLAD